MLTVDSPLVRREARPGAAVRLVCLPYAGAGASVFAGWPRLLDPRIEPVVIQLPGREDRTREPHLADRVRTVRVVAQALRPYLDRPVALFGHCAGALLCYEVACELRRRFGVEPAHLFVSAQAAPFLPARNAPLHGLGDDALVAELERLDGAPTQVLGDDDLMSLLLEVVRADFQLWETYEFPGHSPLACPVTAFTGSDDPRTDPADVAAWARTTTGPFRLVTVPGGHFFINSRPEQVAARIVADLLEPAGGGDGTAPRRRSS